jgi:hypothetical protein
MAYFKKKLPTPQGYEAPVELEAASSKCKSRKRKREGTVETLNTVGGRFKLLDFPHLHMHLKLGETYSTASLVRRCHGDSGKLTALRRQLHYKRIFQLVEDRPSFRAGTKGGYAHLCGIFREPLVSTNSGLFVMY